MKTTIKVLFSMLLLYSLILPHNVISAAYKHKAKLISLFGFEYKLPDQRKHYRFNMRFTKDDVQAEFFVDTSAVNTERVKMKSAHEKKQKEEIKDKISELQEAPLSEIWCTDFLQFVGADIALVTSRLGEITYSFSPTPSEKDDEDDRAFLSNMIAYITIDDTTGALLRFEMRNKQAFKPMLLAKITHFEMLAVCRPYLDGLFYVAEFKTEIAGSFAFSSFKESEKWLVSNFEMVN